jgi:hypothetical protein
VNVPGIELKVCDAAVLPSVVLAIGSYVAGMTPPQIVNYRISGGGHARIP